MEGIEFLTRYSIHELRRQCRRAMRALSHVNIPGHRLVVHDLRPHLLPTGYEGREHIHSYYEAHIVLEGEAWYVTGKPQLLTPGNVLLHAPHMPHCWRSEDTTCLRLLCWFSLEPVLPIPITTWPVWQDILWDIALLFRDAEETLPGWQHRITARVTIILSRLLTLAQGPESQPIDDMAPETTLVAIVDQFFHDNLNRSLSLADVADHVGISTRSLCRQFHGLTGITVMERLLTARMDRAAALLADTHATLAQIAMQTGMSDASYFCRCFRRQFHMTPQRFREQMRMDAMTN